MSARWRSGSECPLIYSWGEVARLTSFDKCDGAGEMESPPPLIRPGSGMKTERMKPFDSVYGLAFDSAGDLFESSQSTGSIYDINVQILQRREDKAAFTEA